MALGLEAGVPPETIEVVRSQRPTMDLDPREGSIIDIVRALFREHYISDDLYARAEVELGRQALVELAGYYGLIGFVLHAFDVDFPAGTTPAFTR
jgi:hypothetical protein